jgi:anthranilate phosphoribosyltransferase
VELGAEHAWIVHGEDGLDELSVCAPTRVIEVRSGSVARELTVDPATLDLARATRSDLTGGDVAENARRLRAILTGEERSPAADAVALNAAAALVVAGVADGLPSGLKASRACLADGTAAAKLDAVVRRARELTG